MKKSGLVFLGAVCGFIGLFIFLAGIGPEWNRTNPPKWNKTKSFGKNDINNDDSYEVNDDGDTEDSSPDKPKSKRRHYDIKPKHKIDPEKLGPHYDENHDRVGCVHAIEGVKVCFNCDYIEWCKYPESKLSWKR